MEANKVDSIEKLTIDRWNLLAGGLLLAIFLTACVVDNSLWRGVTTAKYFYFTMVLCFAVPLTGYLVARRKYPFPFTRSVDIAVGLFALYVIIHRLIMGGGNQMQWWLFLLMIPFYAVARALIERRDGIRVLAIAILLTVLVETVWGILQLTDLLPSYHNAFPVTGSMFNPAPYAGFIAAGIPLALGHLLSRGFTRSERLLGGVVLATSLSVLPFTGSRAAWLASLAGVLAAGWLGYGANRKSITLPSFLRGRRRIVLFFVLGALFIMLMPGMYHMKKDSADGRRLIWNVSVSVIKKHSAAGVGTGRFAAVYGQAQADYFLSGKGTEKQRMIADHPDYAFNEYIHIAVELGLLGLFLFLLVLGMCLLPTRVRPALPDKNTETACCRASFIALLVFGLFSYPFSVLPLVILFVALLAAIVSQTPPLRRQLTFKGYMAGWTAATLLTAIVAFQVLSRRQSYRLWQETGSLFRSGGYSEALDEYLILYPKLKYEKNFLMEYARCLSHLGKYEESNRVFGEYLHLGCNPEVYNYMGNNYKATGQHHQAEQAYIRSSLITPNRHYPQYLLMKLYSDTGREDKAVEKAKLLMNKPVKINSPSIKLIRNEATKILNRDNDHIKEQNNE